MTAKRKGEIASRTRPLSEYPPSKLWTYAELAAYCGVSKLTIRRLVEAHELEVKPLRGSIRITHASFLRYLFGSD